MTAALRIDAPGPSSSIQDFGRPGWFRSGVGSSGAADRKSLALANRLVGNDDGAAAIECLLGGLELTALTAVTVAVTGAPAPATVDETPVGHASVIVLDAGQHLRLGMAPAGLRSYLAVRGGIAVEPVLGSRSWDTLAEIGPEPLSAGAELPVGEPPEQWPIVDVAPVAAMTLDPVVANVVLGPRADWFTDPSALFRSSWLVTDKVDRVGVRLFRDRLSRDSDETELTRVDDRELPTEGMPVGAIQIPPGGEPVVFLADHPITGGYPVIGVVVDDDIGAIAQARPGQSIVFRPVSA